MRALLAAAALLRLVAAQLAALQPQQQEQQAQSAASLLQELGQPMCERPWTTCPPGFTCDREPVGFWCGQYSDDPDACVHQYEWQRADDTVKPCQYLGCTNGTDDCKGSRCSTGVSSTSCAEPAWTTRGTLEQQAKNLLEVPAGDASEADASPEPECGAWSGLPARERRKMQCGVLWYVHVPEAGGKTMYAYFDQKTRAANAKAANGWEFYNTQWAGKRCATNQPCFNGWATTTDKWVGLLQKLRTQKKPKQIVHFYNGFPGMGTGFIENVLSPMQALLESKGCELKIATTIREPTAHAVTHALVHGISKSANSSQVRGDNLRHFVSQWSNLQTKYLLLNKQLWHPALHANDAALDASLMPSARQLLSRFSLVGRAEEPSAFVNAINEALGWPTAWKILDLKNLPHDPGPEDADFSDEELRFVRSTRQTDAALYRSFCSVQNARSAFFVAADGTTLGSAIEGYDSSELKSILASAEDEYRAVNGWPDRRRSQRQRTR